MGWGILGGSAVDAYQKSAKIARDQQWEDQQRAEWARQHGQDVAIDAAANGADSAIQHTYEQANNSGGSQITPEFLKQTLPGLDDAAATDLSTKMKGVQDPQQAAQIIRQYQQDPKYARQGSAQGVPSPQAPPLDQSMAGAPGDTQAPPAPRTASPVDNQSLRAYRGDDGQMYMTASPEVHPPKPSEMLMERARAMMSAGGGVKGIQAGYALQQHALDMMKSEQEQELNGALRSNLPVAAKVQKLMGMINGSPVVPGEATLEKGPDGIYLVHTVPGKDQPFKQKLQGDTEGAILQNLASNIRAMTNPDLMLKMQEHQLNVSKLAEESRHNKRAEDNKQEYANLHAQWMGDRTAMMGDIAASRLAAQQANGARSHWLPYGTDKDNQEVLMDASSGDLKYAGGGKVTSSKDITPYNKVTGDGKGGAGAGLRLPQTLTDAQKLAYPKALDELGPDPSVADKNKIARKYNLPPELLGGAALPSPASLPPLSSPSVSQGQGLQLNSPGTPRQMAMDGLDAAINQTAQAISTAQRTGNNAEVTRLLSILQQQQAAKASTVDNR